MFKKSNLFSFRFCLLTTLVLLFSQNTQAQKRDTLQAVKLLDEIRIYKDQNAYRRELARVRKIYPYALHAAELLDQFDAELGTINSKRKKKKFSKESHQVLKNDYNYVLRDMYRSEGVLLMKLIHRETGLTAAEIIKKYRGKFSASMYKNLGKIWEQDLSVRYDPTGVDKLTESIVLEIENELIEFDRQAKILEKEEFKENMKEYRNRVKDSRKRSKEIKKEKKLKEKAAKKQKL
ncbi:MAG: DUF4294 domain-containing protein [Crocinitomicaceae bacterium]|nr:DUF4294 domain-containing protein [Crocinitomicaceae bacterium]